MPGVGVFVGKVRAILPTTNCVQCAESGACQTGLRVVAGRPPSRPMALSIADLPPPTDSLRPETGGEVKVTEQQPPSSTFAYCYSVEILPPLACFLDTYLRAAAVFSGRHGGQNNSGRSRS